MAKIVKAPTVEAYIKGYPPKVQTILKKIRKAIKGTVPKADEVISYGIPGYKYHGMLIFFAAWKDHISVYPAPRNNKAFKEELSGYKGGKGTVQFPLDKPVPYDLIVRIVKFRKIENEAAYTSKMKTTN
jgi:uncharacterized protein YdhG (YjbR/CyaY superfamily)